MAYVTGQLRMLTHPRHLVPSLNEPISTMQPLDVRTGCVVGGSEVEVEIIGHGCKFGADFSYNYKVGTLSHRSNYESKFISGPSFDLVEMIDHRTVPLFLPKNPGLFLSVTDGLNDVSWQDPDFDNFSSGLSDIAQVSEACLLTGGLSKGMMYYMGKNIATHDSISSIGIVHSNKVTKSVDKRASGHALEMNHKNFILMEDDMSDTEYAVRREQLEKLITSGCGNCAQRVLLVIGGGLETFIRVREALKSKIPVILCENSGGAADILVQKMEKSKKPMKKELRAFIPQYMLNVSLKVLEECMKSENINLVSIVKKKEDKDQWKQSLKIAIGLSIVKAAADTTSSDQLMNLAKRFLKNDMSMLVDCLKHLKETSIKRDILYSIYKQLPSKCGARKLLRISPDSSKKEVFYKVENLLVNLLKDIYEPHLVDELEAEEANPKANKPGELILKKYIHHFSTNSNEKELPIELRVRNEKTRMDMFICCILCEYFDSAMLFWNAEYMANLHYQLVAVGILNRLGKKLYYKEDKERLMTAAVEFHDMSSEFLYACYEADENITEEIILQGNKSYLRTAYKTKNHAFASHPKVTECLNRRWLGFLTKKPGFHYKILIFLTILLPFLIPIKWIWENHRKTDKHSGIAVKAASLFQKIWFFYSAPIVKTVIYVILHMVFLGLYSYMILVELSHDFTRVDLILICWVVSILFEEIRQMFTTFEMTGSRTAYIANPWNITDLTAISLYAIGMGLKSLPYDGTLTAARVVLALDLYVFFIRILHNFTVSETLGPQLVMIVKMLTDLVAFMVIMMVFISAYAITANALLYPNSIFNDDLIGNMYKRSYWILYGENEIDEFDLKEPDCTTDERLYTNETLPRCPAEIGVYIVPYLRAVYSLMVVILMLNLLIAQFNHTFSKIQEKADWYWSLLKLTLVNEYHEKPILPTPVTLLFFPVGIIMILVLSVYFIIFLCLNCKQRKKQVSTEKLNASNGAVPNFEKLDEPTDQKKEKKEDGFVEKSIKVMVKFFWTSGVNTKDNFWFELDMKRQWVEMHRKKKYRLRKLENQSLAMARRKSKFQKQVIDLTKLMQKPRPSPRKVPEPDRNTEKEDKVPRSKTFNINRHCKGISYNFAFDKNEENTVVMNLGDINKMTINNNAVRHINMVDGDRLKSWAKYKFEIIENLEFLRGAHITLNHSFEPSTSIDIHINDKPLESSYSENTGDSPSRKVFFIRKELLVYGINFVKIGYSEKNDGVYAVHDLSNAAKSLNSFCAVAIDENRQGNPYLKLFDNGESCVEARFVVDDVSILEASMLLNTCRTMQNALCNVYINGQSIMAGYDSAPRENFGDQIFMLPNELLQEGTNVVKIELEKTSPAVLWLSDLRVEINIK